MKCMHIVSGLAVVIACLLCQSVTAANLYWYGHQGQSWSNPGSWYNATAGAWNGAVPSAADYVLIGEATGYGATVNVDVPAVASQLQVGAFNSNGTLNLQNSLNMGVALFAGVNAATGQLNLQNPAANLVSPAVYVGHSSNAVMQMSAGTVSCSDVLLVGFTTNANGNLTMTGGTINTNSLHIGLYAGATGIVNLTGGTVTTDWLGIGASGGNGTLVLGDSGKMIIGNKYDTVSGWMTTLAGMMTGPNPRIFNAQAQIVGNTVELTGIPEPGALGLVAAAGMLLRCRR